MSHRPLSLAIALVGIGLAAAFPAHSDVPGRTGTNPVQSGVASAPPLSGEIPKVDQLADFQLGNQGCTTPQCFDKEKSGALEFNARYQLSTPNFTQAGPKRPWVADIQNFAFYRYVAPSGKAGEHLPQDDIDAPALTAHAIVTQKALAPGEVVQTSWGPAAGYTPAVYSAEPVYLEPGQFRQGDCFVARAFAGRVARSTPFNTSWKHCVGTAVGLGTRNLVVPTTPVGTQPTNLICGLIPYQVVSARLHCSTGLDVPFTVTRPDCFPVNTPCGSQAWLTVVQLNVTNDGASY